MLERHVVAPDGSDERLVRRYLSALSHGRLLDALDTFSMDASLRDESGREQRGIREIARAFARREYPVQLDIEDLEKEGEAVAVRLRMRFPESQDSREYRGVFRVSRNRIRSLELEPVPARVARRRGHVA